MPVNLRSQAPFWGFFVLIELSTFKNKVTTTILAFARRTTTWRAPARAEPRLYA